MNLMLSASYAPASNLGGSTKRSRLRGPGHRRNFPSALERLGPCARSREIPRSASAEERAHVVRRVVHLVGQLQHADRARRPEAPRTSWKRCDW